MIYWPFVFSPEQWDDYLRSQGIDPADMPNWAKNNIEPAPVGCQICTKDISEQDVYIQVDPPPGIVHSRRYHLNCFQSHVEEHAENLQDDTCNFAFRKKL